MGKAKWKVLKLSYCSLLPNPANIVNHNLGGTVEIRANIKDLKMQGW